MDKREKVENTIRDMIGLQYDQTQNSGGKTRFLPGGLDARGNLVAALAAAVGEQKASEIADALDLYLEEDPSDRVPMREDLTPSRRALADERDEAIRQRDEAIRQRDEAVARAKSGERRQRRSDKKKPNGKSLPT